MRTSLKKTEIMDFFLHPITSLKSDFKLIVL